MINWEKIREEFETTTITLKALSEKYDVSSSTMRSRKNREGWRRNEVTQRLEVLGNVATDKPGGQIHNRNAVGNKGGAPPGNKNNLRHGLFAKYLPEEMNEIISQMDGLTEADILWNNIELQYAAIIRSQQIMFVKDRDEMIKAVKKSSTTYHDEEKIITNEFEFQFSWDRYATYIKALATANNVLVTMIKRFSTMTDELDERRQRLELMTQQTEKTKAEIAILRGNKEGNNDATDWKALLDEIVNDGDSDD